MLLLAALDPKLGEFLETPSKTRNRTSLRLGGDWLQGHILNGVTELPKFRCNLLLPTTDGSCIQRSSSFFDIAHSFVEDLPYEPA